MFLGGGPAQINRRVRALPAPRQLVHRGEAVDGCVGVLAFAADHLGTGGGSGPSATATPAGRSAMHGSGAASAPAPGGWVQVWQGPFLFDNNGVSFDHEPPLRNSGGVLTPDDVADLVDEHLTGLTDAFLEEQLGGALTGALNQGRFDARRADRVVSDLA